MGPPPTPSLPSQASGPAYTTYDETTGAFRDPAGGTGIFAAGANTSSAENWVDLMLDPRPM
jgi:phospholipid/cholesterol/gamma-HCH transport system substrate-binding protein